MNLTNFKTRITIKMEMLLDDWRNNRVTWTVANQFNESILESALESMTDENISKAYELYGDKEVNTMEYAHYLSSFEAPEIENCWID